MLALIPPQIKAGAITIAAALALVAGTIVYNSIYDRGYQAAVVVALAEKAKIKAANDKAISEARRGLERQLADLIFTNKQVEQNVTELDAQADADPAAARPALSADSMRRIDAIH